MEVWQNTDNVGNNITGNQDGAGGYMQKYGYALYWHREDEYKGTGMMGRNEIEEKAGSLAGAGSDFPIPVYDIARRLGVKVWVADFGDLAEEYSGFCDFREGEIYLNRDDNAIRRVFTAAHELGHLLLHEDYFEKKGERFAFLPRYSSAVDDSEQEKEANLFARCLLLPRAVLEPHLKGGNEPSVLAAAFDVTTDLLEERQAEIGTSQE